MNKKIILPLALLVVFSALIFGFPVLWSHPDLIRQLPSRAAIIFVWPTSSLVHDFLEKNFPDPLSWSAKNWAVVAAGQPWRALLLLEADSSLDPAQLNLEQINSVNLVKQISPGLLALGHQEDDFTILAGPTLPASLRALARQALSQKNGLLILNRSESSLTSRAQVKNNWLVTRPKFPDQPIPPCLALLVPDKNQWLFGIQSPDPKLLLELQYLAEEIFTLFQSFQTPSLKPLVLPDQSIATEAFQDRLSSSKISQVFQFLENDYLLINIGETILDQIIVDNLWKKTKPCG